MANYTNEAEVIQAARFYPDGKLMAHPVNRKFYLTVKKIMDITGSFFGILLCSPLFFVVAVLIKLEDPKGSVFFKQIRLGKHGKAFYMYKFRSMVANSEELLQELLDKK